MKEKKARVEDAMHATKAAVEEGIVPGGGVVLLKSAKVLDGLKLDGDQKVGADIVRRAIEAPMRWIANNAGVEGSIVIQRVRESKNTNDGYNAATDVYEDMWPEHDGGAADCRRGARLARRDDREYRVYLREEQRRQAGCPAGKAL